MKVKHSHIIIFSLAIIALIINVFLFYIPHVRGNYLITETPEQRLQVVLKGGDYLEIFWGHDFWQSTESEYDSLVRGNPQREVTYTENWITGQKNEIIEIVENADIKVESKLKAVNSQNFTLERRYEIKNEYLLEDLDTLYIQLIIGSDFHSFTKEESRLNFTQCKLTIDKPGHLQTKYDYSNSFLEISRKIHEEMKRNNTYTINLNLNINCE